MCCLSASRLTVICSSSRAPPLTLRVDIFSLPMFDLYHHVKQKPNGIEIYRVCARGGCDNRVYISYLTN